MTLSYFNYHFLATSPGFNPRFFYLVLVSMTFNLVIVLTSELSCLVVCDHPTQAILLQMADGAGASSPSTPDEFTGPLGYPFGDDPPPLDGGGLLPGDATTNPGLAPSGGPPPPPPSAVVDENPPRLQMGKDMVVDVTPPRGGEVRTPTPPFFPDFSGFAMFEPLQPLARMREYARGLLAPEVSEGALCSLAQAEPESQDSALRQKPRRGSNPGTSKARAVRKLAPPVRLGIR